MRSRLAIKIHAILEHYFPERRVFLKSDTDTRFIRLRPGTQVIAFAGSAMLVLQTVLPVLMTADGPSTVTVEGGTHNMCWPSAAVA